MTNPAPTDALNLLNFSLTKDECVKCHDGFKLDSTNK